MLKKIAQTILILSATFIISCDTSPKEGTTQEEVISAKELSSIISFEQWYTNPKPLISAHRGGPYSGYPENAIETFQYVVDSIHAVIIECDVSMTKDSVLVMLHDKTLDRTTTGSGQLVDFYFDEIKMLRLLDNEGDTTAFTIPTLEQTLKWGKNKALFTLDVKRGVPFDKVIQMVELYEATDYAAVITYRIEDAELVYSMNTEIIISVSAGSERAIAQIIKSGIPVSNLLGFVGTREPDALHYDKLGKLGIKTILGTLGNLDKSARARGNDQVYLKYVKNGANIIATDRPLEVAKVFYSDI